MQESAEDRAANGSAEAPDDDANDSDASAIQEVESMDRPDTTSSTQPPSHANGNPTNTTAASGNEQNPSDAGLRLAAAAKERDELRAQVTELRKELEGLQQKHDDETVRTKKQLEETQTGKEHAENRYNKLLGQVNTIKTQLGERLKADAVSYNLRQSLCLLSTNAA